MAGKGVERSNRAERMRRAEEVLSYRLRGMSPSAIADVLGLSVGTVERDIEWALHWRLSPKVDAWRAVEDARLDAIAMRLEAIVHAPEEAVRVPERLAALNALLKVSDRRSKLHGLDAPVVVEASVAVDVPLPPEVQALVDGARTAAEEERQRLVAQVLQRTTGPSPQVSP